MRTKNLYYCKGCAKEGADPYWHKGRIGSTKIKMKESDAIKKRCPLHISVKV